MKNKFLIPALLVALHSSAALAKEGMKKTIAPEAKAIIEKGIKAVGGQEAIAKVKTRRLKGKAEAGPGVTVELELFQKAPNKVFSKMVVPGMMEAEQGFDGEVGWSKDSIQGIRELQGPELAQLKETAALFIEAHILEEAETAKVLADEKINETNYKVVEVKGKSEAVKTLYFNAENHLLHKIKTKAAVGPQGEMEMEMEYADYKEIDGVKQPMVMIVGFGPQKMMMKMSEVVHNETFDDKMFAKPE